MQKAMSAIQITEVKATAAELADLLGLTDRTIRRLAEAGTIPPATEGRFPLREAVRGYVVSLRRRKDAPKLADAKRRRAECQARMAELDLQAREGSLISVDECDRRLRPGMVSMRQIILSSDLSDDQKDNCSRPPGNIRAGIYQPAAKGRCR